MKYMLIHCIDEDAERSRRPEDRQPIAGNDCGDIDS